MSLGVRMLPVVVLLAVLGLAGSAAAQQPTDDQNLLDMDFVANIGGFLVGSDTKVRLDGETSTGTSVDLGRKLDTGGDSLRARADFLWRISPRHHLRGLYFSDSRDGHGALTEDVEWGDYTFGAGSSVEARTRFSVGEVAYEYAFVKKARAEGNVSIGVHWIDLDVELEGEALDQSGMPVGVVAESASGTGPFPVIGLRGAWSLPHHWTVDLQGQFFFGSFDNYDGNIQDYRVGATWLATRHFGVGLGYNLFVVDVDVSKSGFDGNLRWGYDGLQGYLTFAF